MSLSPSHALLSTANSGASSQGNRPRERDAEQLSGEVRLLKENGNAAAKDNAFLKAQLQRLVAQLRKKDRQIEQLLDMKIHAMSDAGSDAILAGQLRELRSEMTTLARLSDKCRELEASQARKDEEIRRLKASVRFTNVAEMEIEAQTYLKEALRMKKALAATQQQVTQLQQQLVATQQAQQQQQQQLQQQQQQQQQQHQWQHYPQAQSHASSGYSSPSNRYATPARGGRSHAGAGQPHDSALSSSSSRETMPEELAALRAENLRLRSEAARAAVAQVVHPAMTARSGARTAAAVLRDLAQLQEELQDQIAAEELSAAAEQDHWADSAEYAIPASSTASSTHGDGTGSPRRLIEVRDDEDDDEYSETYSQDASARSDRSATQARQQQQQQQQQQQRQLAQQQHHQQQQQRQGGVVERASDNGDSEDIEEDYEQS
jgi:hypothetical protein